MTPVAAAPPFDVILCAMVIGTYTQSARAATICIQSTASHFILLTLWAVLLACAFPEPGWGTLAHVALVPMAILAIRSDNARRLAWTGYAVAFVWWLVRVNWMMPVTFGGYIALAACLAIYLPLTLLALRRLACALPNAPMTLLLPMVWVSLELVRTYFPAGGFNWFSLGHSQAPFNPNQASPRLIQIADTLGVHGVSFLVAMTNGLIVDALTRRLTVKRKRTGTTRFNPVLKWSVIVWAAAMIGTWNYGDYRIRQTDQVQDGSLRLAVVQTNVPQDHKNNPTPDQVLTDWQRLIELTRQAAATNPPPQLIIWPETMVPAGLNRDALAHYQTDASNRDLFHRHIQTLAKTLGTHILVGAHAYFDWKAIPTANGDAYFSIPNKRYNSVYLYRPDGTQASDRYDKIHRVPFGEYIPWVESFPWLKRQFIRYLSPYEVDYTVQPGRAWTLFEVSTAKPRTVADSPVARIATPICFEDAVARVTRRMVYRSGKKAAHLLVNLTNDGWYAGTDQGPQHLQIAVFRCIETRTPMARSVNTGISGFIDSVGRIGPVVQADGRQQQVDGSAAHTVTFDSRLTPYSWLGDTPAILLATLTAGMLLVATLRRRP